MGNHPHDGSGSGRSRRRGQAIEVDGGGEEPVDGRHSEHQGRPAIGTSPAKRVSSVLFTFLTRQSRNQEGL